MFDFAVMGANLRKRMQAMGVRAGWGWGWGCRMHRALRQGL